MFWLLPQLHKHSPLWATLFFDIGDEAEDSGFCDDQVYLLPFHRYLAYHFSEYL